MREIIDEVGRWLDAGERRIAVATVLATYGSAPRGVGAKMAVGERGQIAGSISGGCIESAVIEEGLSIAPGAPPKLLRFETTDESAWEVGLPCGGAIELVLEPLALDHFEFLRARIARNEHAGSLTVIGGPPAQLGKKISFDLAGASTGSVDPALDRGLVGLVRAAAATKRLQTGESIELFAEHFPPAPTLVMIGGVHIAIALARIARVLGWRTAVVDPRRTFGNPERFPDVDRLLTDWPKEAFAGIKITADSAVAVLTHDPKLDDPALEEALRSPAFYIGALGSRRTQERRRARLERLGFSSEALERIRGPVGLDIGAAAPEEIALAIAGEIVASMRGAKSALRVSAFARQPGG